ncbi:peptidoglycan-recognition protein 1-like isoform X2 [Topomyia yanbarensis]|uniref:peptidoglycan-recognition protein 1-like isoform X2 n=1 Tax=Topomyia yanbarensis TaxID=2498891 RepID=UPI00273AB9B6|nr:peptidoglycan-recognition protein 1-like isoform X2 [Topomyia yanbarensis]
MFCLARTAAVSSSNRLKNPVSRSNSSEYDVEIGERTPLLLAKVHHESARDRRNQQLQTIQTTALLGILALVLFLLLGIIIAIYLMLLQVPRPWPVSHPFYLVERPTWWSHSAALEASPLNKSAVMNLIVMHTGSEPCHDQATCCQSARDAQNYAWDNTATHIPYNFLIGGDGKTYEARGWKGQHGFPELPGRNDTIVVGIIGTYNNKRPDDVLFAETKALITESIRRFSLSPAYRMYGVVNQSTSGNNAVALYAELKRWKHWKGFITI